VKTHHLGWIRIANQSCHSLDQSVLQPTQRPDRWLILALVPGLAVDNMSSISSNGAPQGNRELEPELDPSNVPNHFESTQSLDQFSDSSNSTHFQNELATNSNARNSHNYMNGKPSTSHTAVYPNQYYGPHSNPTGTSQAYDSIGFVNHSGYLDPYSTTSNSDSLSPLSPSTFNHLSPAAAILGYSSDNTRSEISEHTTPSFDEEPIDVDFGLASGLDEDQAPIQAFPGVVISPDTSGQDRDNGIPPHNAASYPLSPVNSNIASPTSNERDTLHPAEDRSFNNITSTPLDKTPVQFSATTATMQQTPALTGSSKSSSHDGTGPSMRHLASPIVMVENYSRGESPSREQLSRSLSKRSRGSQLSTYLSPNMIDDEFTEDYDETSIGRSGINPITRNQMNLGEIPTLQEQEDARQIVERNVEIAQWLSKSDTGSDVGDPPSPRTLGSGLRARPVDRRRAKSVGDSRFMSNTATLDDSAIPGPGILLDVDSGSEDGDEESFVESPPADIDETYSESEDLYRTVDEEPHPSQFRHSVRPWADPQIDTYEARDRPEQIQPPTANAAIMWLHRQAGDIETSSRVATWGTRRLSETDVDKFIKHGGVLKRLSFGKEKAKSKPERRHSGFLNSLLQRAPSNKRRHSEKNVQVPPASSSERKRKDSGSSLLPPSRTSSFPARRSQKLSTIGAMAAMTEQMAAVASHSVSATNTTPPAGPWERGKQMIKRSRSKSDLIRSTSSEGLKGLWSKAGGPPVASLATGPLDLTNLQDEQPPSTMQDHLDEDDEREDEPMEPSVKMELNVRNDQIIPTPQGFLTHAQQLNPRLLPFLAERIKHEQVTRYKRLSKSKIAHLNAAKAGHCSSTPEFCHSLGGKAKILQPKMSQRDSDTPFVGFQVSKTGLSDDEDSTYGEGAVASAQFPQGVPLPPTKRLPAEFECTICYNVKKFQKPSDWTKHVHEDVQPFTCTWPRCTEPKSFKRKADWVRHENERHRKLEWWTCNIPECSHTCFRKDNFVQHLVREHKLPEPKLKSTKASAKSAGKGKSGRDIVEANDDSSQARFDRLWSLVEQCRHDTTKRPQDEPCKFCGNTCNSWKKLTVHLARHMEQISLPILALVEDRHGTADTIISPINQQLPPNQSLSPMTPVIATKIESVESSPYNNQSYFSLHQIPQHVPFQEVSHPDQFGNVSSQHAYSNLSPLPNTYDHSQGQVQRPISNYADPAPDYSSQSYGIYPDSSTRSFVPVNSSASTFNEMPGNQAYVDPLGTHGSTPNVSAYSSSTITAGPFHQSITYALPSDSQGYGFESDGSLVHGQHPGYPLEGPQDTLLPRDPDDQYPPQHQPRYH
jgi:hypothetical protein